MRSMAAPLNGVLIHAQLNGPPLPCQFWGGRIAQIAHKVSNLFNITTPGWQSPLSAEHRDNSGLA